MASTLLELARPYQRQDIEKIVSWGGQGILGHKTGLGKTFIALGVWQRLGSPRKVLVVGSNSSMSVWLKEVPRWTEQRALHITGAADQRASLLSKVKDCYFSGETLFVCCNFDILRREVAALSKIPFDMLIVDEAHKARHRKTVTWKALCSLRLGIKYFVAASATLASRGPQDLWGILHLIDRGRFSSYWRFVSTYCHIVSTQFGKEIVGVKNPAQLRALLYGNYYVSRTYEEVLPDLPPVTREVVELDMTDSPVQEKVYRQLDKEMVAVIKDYLEETEENRILLVPSALAKITRLRQLLVCPPLLGLQVTGAGISYLREALEDDPHTVIFTPFAQALPHLKQALERVEGVTGVWTLQGGMKPTEVNASIEAFKANRGVMLCTIAFAQSFALDTVHTAYFLGFSWDPTENTQAEGRLRRMDSKDFQGVCVKYLVHTGTIDEAVRAVLNGKTITVRQFMEEKANEGHSRRRLEVHESV